MDLQFVLVALLLPVLTFLLIIAATTQKAAGSDHAPPLPPSPWRLPVLGHVHHLVCKLTHRALRDLAARHGDLMLLKVGQIDVVVVSSCEAAAEVLRTRDADFASRPPFDVSEFIAYGNTDLFFAPYGGYWRQMRKVSTVELLSARRVRSFAAIRDEQTLNLVRDISEAPRMAAVNLSSKLMAMSHNIIAGAAFGQKFERLVESDFLPVAKAALESLTGLSFTECFPSLKFIDVLAGKRFRLKIIRRKIDEITDEIIKNHQIKKSSRQLQLESNSDGNTEEDLVDVLLRIKDHANLEIPLTLDNIKAVIFDMFLAGSDTSATTVEWAMSELMRNPNAMKKVQREVRDAVKDRINSTTAGTKLEEVDIQRLSYLKMVINETLRLHPPAPLLVRRAPAEVTCSVLGFKIPRESRIVVNVWALGRDERYWEHAESFLPERFDGRAGRRVVDFKGTELEFIPFGAGRRMCPGIHFAMATVELALARLLFYFDWELPHGVGHRDLDMVENSGGIASRKSPLKLLATPRSNAVA